MPQYVVLLNSNLPQLLRPTLCVFPLTASIASCLKRQLTIRFSPDTSLHLYKNSQMKKHKVPSEPQPVLP